MLVCVCVCIKPGIFYRAGRSEMIEPFCKTVWWFLIKVSIHLLEDSTVSLLGLDQRKMKTHGHIKTNI